MVCKKQTVYSHLSSVIWKTLNPITGYAERPGSAHRCQKNARPFVQGEEQFGDINIEWNKKHLQMKGFWAQHFVPKEMWVKRVEAVLVQLEDIKRDAYPLLDELTKWPVDNSEIQHKLSNIEAKALRILLEDAGSRGVPPYECRDCDSVFLNMVSNFHNIFIPFAAWGKGNWGWHQKVQNTISAQKQYEEDRRAFTYEWRKVRR